MDNKNYDKELENSLNKLLKTNYEEIFPNFIVFAVEIKPNKLIYLFQVSSEFDKHLNIFLNDDQYTTFEKYMRSSNSNNRLKQAEDFFSQDYISIQLPGFPNDDFDEYAGPFQRFYPHRLPVKVEGKEAEEVIEVLNTLTKIAKSNLLNRGNLNRELPIINGRGVIPVIKPRKNGYLVDNMAIDLDITKEEEFEDLIFEDDILLSKLKQNPYKGNFALEFIYGSVPLIVTDIGPDPFFLNGMLIYDYLTECMEPIGCEHSYLDEPDKFLHDFAEDLLTFELLPYEVHIRDKKTLSIVKDLFDKLNVTIIFEEEIPELDKAEDEIFDIERHQEEMTHEDVDELGKILDDIIDMDLPFSKRLVNNYYKFNEQFDSEEENSKTEDYSNNIIEINDTRSIEYIADVTGLGKFRMKAPVNETIEGLIFYLLDNIDYKSVYPDWKSDASFDNDALFDLMENVPKEVGRKYEHSMENVDNKEVNLEIKSTSPEIINRIIIEPIE